MYLNSALESQVIEDKFTKLINLWKSFYQLILKLFCQRIFLLQETCYYLLLRVLRWLLDACILLQFHLVNNATSSLLPRT
jgi:hypothetical protein